MQKDAKQDELLSPEIQDAMKNLATAIRVVKIYPPNNPVYSQSIKKSHESLTHFLQTSPDFRLGVQKACFTYLQTPFSRDSQVNKTIIQDLFAKGIREIVFNAEVSEAELVELYRALALPPEELAMKNGISTILWEKGATHITVTEAGLDEVITGGTEGRDSNAKEGAADGEKKPRKAAPITGRTLVLGDLKTDPESFGASMVEFARRTRAGHESLEDRLFTLYQQASHKISSDHAQDSEALFEGLAKSVLALEPLYRDSLIAGRLYGELDAESDAEGDFAGQSIPNEAQEIRTGRFSHDWTSQQVAVLLKRTASKKITPPVPPPDPAAFPVAPIAPDLMGIARSLQDESPEYIEAMKTISSTGMESDIIEAAVRTLIAVIPLVKSSDRSGSTDKEKVLFSGIILQLEDLLGYLLKKNNYALATTIIDALRRPVAPEFQPRMQEALRKTATKISIKETITEMRKYVKGSPEYNSAYAYLVSLDRKAIEALLELLADEGDRAVRIYLLDLLKDFGKNQTTLLGDHLLDERWYVVRNVVSILGENKTDQALAMLRRAADHRNVKIRQEVIKALISIGGKKAANVLARFLRDQDPDIQLTAAHALADFPGAGAEEAKLLMEFLDERRLKKKDLGLTLAGIRALGSNGGGDAAFFLGRYTRIRWWKPRKLQEELRKAAARSIEEITRREGNGVRAKR